MKGFTLEKIMKDLDGFDYDVKMYIYHKLNGRDEEAQTYLNAYQSVVDDTIEELLPRTLGCTLMCDLPVNNEVLK